jgi:RimJ/RimL family protein N-acetyltransferase
MVKFRKITDADIPLMVKWLNKEHIKKWFEIPGLCSIDDWLYEIKNRNGEFSWLNHYIFEIDGEPFGFGVYYDCWDAKEDWYEVETEREIFSIDYLIGESSFLGKGYGKEIVRFLTEAITTVPTAKYIIVKPDGDNLSSCGVLTANNYRYNEDKKYYALQIKT